MWAAGCSADDDKRQARENHAAGEAGAAGESVSSGGSASGGSASGGSATGGSATGGSATGGSAMGGAGSGEGGEGAAAPSAGHGGEPTFGEGGAGGEPSLPDLGPVCGQVGVPPSTEVPWDERFGTAISDRAQGVAADGSSNVFVAGFTGGQLATPLVGGGYDIFLRKLDSSGDEVWVTQLGSVANDFANAVAVDADGNSWVAGPTFGSLDGDFFGGSDGYVIKLSAAGSPVWTFQDGTTVNEDFFDVAVDAAGNSYASGFTAGDLSGTNAGLDDAIVTKLNAQGAVEWTHQFGTVAAERAFGVAVDGEGNVFTGGWTRGDLGKANKGGWDPFVRKIDSEGVAEWTYQFGLASDQTIYDVAVDSEGNVIAVGFGVGDIFCINKGSYDAFILKLDPGGTPLWIDHFGGVGTDQLFSVAIDSHDNIIAAGHRTGVGATQVAFARKVTKNGTLIWMRDSFVSGDLDYTEGVAIDANDNALVAGHIDSDANDNDDCFVAKLAK